MIKTEEQKAKRREAQRRRRAADPLYLEKARLAVVEWRRKRNESETPEQRTERAAIQKIRHAAWREKTRGRKDIVEVRQQNYRSWYHRTKNDVQNRIKRNLRGRMSSAIRSNAKAGSAVRDLGCTVNELKQHLEAQFEPCMTWNNWGEWHIDHIIPLSFFNLADLKQFRQAAHYSNLQPLWAADNLSKGAK